MKVSTVRRDHGSTPAVDERLVAPNTRYEILHGQVEYVVPADEPHATTHSAVDRVVAAHRADGYEIAVDMLTRTSEIDDVAPDVSVYPAARDPRTGGRQLEELTFQVASTETLAHCGEKAATLTARGVRRVFAIDVSCDRVLEWSTAISAWQLLDRAGEIEDPVLAVPLPLAALLDAGHADAAVARALRQRRHPDFLAERAEGREEGRAEGREEGRARGLAEAVLRVLAARGLAPTDPERDRILAERDPERQTRWLTAAVTCRSVGELLADTSG
jgi:hypothetical protein